MCISQKVYLEPKWLRYAQPHDGNNVVVLLQKFSKKNTLRKTRGHTPRIQQRGFLPVKIVSRGNGAFVKIAFSVEDIHQTFNSTDSQFQQIRVVIRIPSSKTSANSHEAKIDRIQLGRNAYTQRYPTQPISISRGHLQQIPKQTLNKP